MFNGKIHYKWPFSIAMLVHQRVILTIKMFYMFPPCSRTCAAVDGCVQWHEIRRAFALGTWWKFHGDPRRDGKTTAQLLRESNCTCWDFFSPKPRYFWMYWICLHGKRVYSFWGVHKVLVNHLYIKGVSGDQKIKAIHSYLYIHTHIQSYTYASIPTSDGWASCFSLK